MLPTKLKKSRKTTATSGYEPLKKPVEEEHMNPSEEPSELPVVSHQQISTECSKDRYLILSILTLLSFITRLYRIDYPPWVCWDETHFGKMASWYINRTFFFDVHPPFGKMSISLVGYLSGYNGTFAWDKPGDRFLDYPYTGMRIYCAILGSLLVPLAFEIVYSLSKSTRAATLAGALILSDTGLATLTRYILLDAPLLFFILAATWAFVRSLEFKSKSTSLQSLSWLSLCGFFLSCAISVKFVGAFVVLWVGFGTIFQLLSLWSDISIPISALLKELIVRVFSLILLPAGFYILFFWIHLSVLIRSGPGDGFYTSSFQSSLIGNPLNNATMPEEVAYGALIALKNTKGNGAYLHSHLHMYPQVGNAEANQQQVTCYSHKDDNNLWTIKKRDEEISDGGTKTVEILRQGDLVRLNHFITGKYLHAHRVPAPVSRHHYQVSGYGVNNTFDVNDVWQVEIENGRSGDHVKTMTTHFRLIHYATKCALESSTKQLPKWGWEQLEVSCNPRPKLSSFDYQLFHIEWVYFPLLPNVTFANHAPSFFSRFVESHKVMIKGNSGLKPKEGEVFSKPWQWPLDLRGQWFSAGETRIYLLGNPFIWWGNIVCWFVYIGLEIFVSLRRKRLYEEVKELNDLERVFLPACRWMMIGFLIHYLPFYGMGRILYYHHYFPAHLFSCMLSGLAIDSLVQIIGTFSTNSLLKNVFLHSSQYFVFIFLILGFYLFYPLAYGMSGSFADNPNSTLHGFRWLSSWEF